MSRPAAPATASLLLVLLAGAAPTPGDLEAARRAQAAAAEAARGAAAAAQASAAQAGQMAAQRVAAAAELRATEDRLSEVGEQIAGLQARRDEAAAAARAQATRLLPLLPLIERLGLYPAETLLSAPGDPEQAVRGLLVLQGFARRVQADIAALTQQQQREAAASRALQQTQALQAAALARQREQAAALDASLTEAVRGRDAAQDAAERAARRAAGEAARAQSLRAALAALDTARREAAADEAAAPPAAAGRGGWVMPVAGRLASGFRAASDAGPTNGASFRTPAGARVVAPCAGRVAFAGPFRSYGLLLILQCGGGVHAVLAGLARLDAAVGQAMRPGEPVGVMGPAGDTLYVEIRRAGVAIDPIEYLRQKG